MSKRDHPHNVILSSVVNLQKELHEVKDGFQELKSKLVKKNKKVWTILSVSGTLIIFLTSIIQNIWVAKLDSFISKGSEFVINMANLDNRLTMLQYQVHQSRIAFYENNDNMGLLNNLCSLYASYCTVSSNMKIAIFEWLPVGTKISQNEVVDSQMKEIKVAEGRETLLKLQEFYYKKLVDSLDGYFNATQLTYYAYNDDMAKMCANVLKGRERKRSKIKDIYTFCLLLGGLLSAIGSFKSIFQ